MKTNRTSLLTLVLVLTAAYCGLGLATEAQAQQVVYYYSTPAPQPVYYSADPVAYQVYYDRVYQGASWHWNPELGWHTHAQYNYVPRWVPTTRVYQQPLSVPTTTTYYAW
jgi:hypothetical protein